MEKMYYDVLDYISLQVENKTDEILNNIRKDLGQTKYKFVNESEEIYNYGIILNEIYDMFLLVVEEKSLVEGVLGIFDEVRQIGQNKEFDSDGLYKKYFNKENEKYYLHGMNRKLVDIADQIMKMEDQELDGDDIEESIRVYTQRIIDEVLDVLKSDIEIALQGKEVQQDA